MKLPWSSTPDERRKAREKERELDEWDYHHNSGMQSYNEEFFNNLWMESHERTKAEWVEAHQKAGHLIGNRAPADYAEFMAYGYTQGRLDAMRQEQS